MSIPLVTLVDVHLTFHSPNITRAPKHVYALIDLSYAFFVVLIIMDHVPCLACRMFALSFNILYGLKFDNISIRQLPTSRLYQLRMSFHVNSSFPRFPSFNMNIVIDGCECDSL